MTIRLVGLDHLVACFAFSWPAISGTSAFWFWFCWCCCCCWCCCWCCCCCCTCCLFVHSYARLARHCCKARPLTTGHAMLLCLYVTTKIHHMMHMVHWCSLASPFCITNYPITQLPNYPITQPPNQMMPMMPMWYCLVPAVWAKPTNQTDHTDRTDWAGVTDSVQVIQDASS